MQPLRVGDVTYEPTQVLLGVVERLVVVQGHLLPFQGLEETLRLGVVVGISRLPTCSPALRHR